MGSHPVCRVMNTDNFSNEFNYEGLAPGDERKVFQPKADLPRGGGGKKTTSPVKQ